MQLVSTIDAAGAGTTETNGLPLLRPSRRMRCACFMLASVPSIGRDFCSVTPLWCKLDFVACVKVCALQPNPFRLRSCIVHPCIYCFTMGHAGAHTVHQMKLCLRDTTHADFDGVCTVQDHFLYAHQDQFTFCPYREAVNDIGLSSASGGI
jgi:hypothetical protein